MLDGGGTCCLLCVCRLQDKDESKGDGTEKTDKTNRLSVAGCSSDRSGSLSRDRRVRRDRSLRRNGADGEVRAASVGRASLTSLGLGRSSSSSGRRRRGERSSNGIGSLAGSSDSDGLDVVVDGSNRASSSRAVGNVRRAASDGDESGQVNLDGGRSASGRSSGISNRGGSLSGRSRVGGRGSSIILALVGDASVQVVDLLGEGLVGDGSTAVTRGDVVGDAEGSAARFGDLGEVLGEGGGGVVAVAAAAEGGVLGGGGAAGHLAVAGRDGVGLLVGEDAGGGFDAADVLVAGDGELGLRDGGGGGGSHEGESEGVHFE